MKNPLASLPVLLPLLLLSGCGGEGPAAPQSLGDEDVDQIAQEMLLQEEPEAAGPALRAPAPPALDEAEMEAVEQEFEAPGGAHPKPVKK